MDVRGISGGGVELRRSGGGADTVAREAVPTSGITE